MMIRREACSTRAATLCALLLGASCAKSLEQQGGSGETHFLSSCTGNAGCGSDLDCLAGVCSTACEATSECVALADEATCEALPAGAGDAGARTCDVRCARDEDCGDLGAGYACSEERCRAADERPDDAGVAERSCPAGCVAVNGYPEDAERGCVDRARLGFVGCDCSPEMAITRCGRRSADDTLWMFAAGELDAASDFAACTAQESGRLTHACEFDDCEVPPLSICSLEGTCADRGCDNLEFDANGCRHRPCADDAECADDERCVALACTSTSFCTVANAGPDEQCGCGGAALCLPGGACNPVTSVGPRGAWQRVELRFTNEICCASAGGSDCPACVSSWTADASGEVTISMMSTGGGTRSALLSEADREALALLIDGPTLRVGLRDGFECALLGGDTTTLLSVELADETLAQAVTGCEVEAVPELKQLEDLLMAY